MAGLYDYRWQKRRKAQLVREPICRICKRAPATIADHITPHRGDRALFEGPLQSLCKRCHDSIKQQVEKSGTFSGCDAQGYPLDSSHWWSARKREEKNVSALRDLERPRASLPSKFRTIARRIRDRR